MGMLDKLTGTRTAKPGVEPVSADELRAALLGLNRDSAPWQVRDGAPDKCDLVAEWRIADERWHAVFSGHRLNSVFRIKMKFDQAAHEVRNIQEESTVSWNGGIPSVSASWSRGQSSSVSWSWSPGQGSKSQSSQGAGYTEADQFGQTHTYNLNSSEIRDPLRDAVNDRGWDWKAVSFKL